MQELTKERVSPAREQDAFEVMFERAGFGVAHVSLEGEWLAVNQSLCDILGYPRAQLLRKTLSDITRFDDLASELADCHRLLRGELASFSSEKRHLRGDGRVVWLKATVTLVRDDDTGEPASYLAIVEDMTPQRKAIQQILFESDKRLHVLADNISDLFFTLDGDLKCTYWNKAAENITGLSSGKIIGKHVDEILSGSNARVGAAICRVLDTQQAYRFSLPCKLGEHDFLLEVTTYPAKDGISVVASDLGASKRADEALRESEERFRIMADSAPILMWMAGLDKGCTDFNRGWLEFTGRTMAQEKGDGWAVGVYPADLERCLRTYSNAFDQRIPFAMEYRLRRHDGQYRWIKDTGVPRFRADGTFVGYIGCCVDVDDQKQAELARADLSRRLMTAQEAERSRIARELHDGIGQSLALLSIQLQRAGQPASSGKKGPGIAELCVKLKQIGHQVSRLSHQLHSSELEFLGLAVAVKSLCREFSEQYHISIGCVCTDLPFDLENDIALGFLRVVQEALHNVAKHSRAARVDVTLAAEGNDLILTVADDGVGFDMKKVRNTAGLGMISMRERMQLIGGEFHVTSQPDGGTKIQARAPALACRK
jgi:PAS domain S-box-containing protein